MIWFSVRIFSPKPLEPDIFSPAYNGVRFFSSIIRHEIYFFQCRIFFPRNQAIGRIFFSEISYSLMHPPPLKSQTFGPLTLFWDYFKTLRHNLKTSVRLFQVVVYYTCKPEFFFRLCFRNYISCVYNNCDVLLSRFVSSFRSSNIRHSYNHPQFQLILQIKFLMFTPVL